MSRTKLPTPRREIAASHEPAIASLGVGIPFSICGLTGRERHKPFHKIARRSDMFPCRYCGGPHATEQCDMFGERTFAKPVQSIAEFKREADVGDFDAYLEYVSSLEDSYEHKKMLIRSDKCFQEWCERQRDDAVEQAIAFEKAQREGRGG